MDLFGQTVQWTHLGDDHSYIAIQSGGEGTVADWKTRWTGVKHVGIVVPDLDAVVEGLAAIGYEVDHFGGTHPHRKIAYFVDPHSLQFEFIEYLSTDPSERNEYSK